MPPATTVRLDSPSEKLVPPEASPAPHEHEGAGQGEVGLQQRAQQRPASHLSPSMDLKSLTMAMPSPAREYRTVRTVTSHRSSPKSACEQCGSDCCSVQDRSAGA